jgi:hypothetical protein
MDYAKHLLAHHFPLFARMLRERDDIWVPYHAWIDSADERYINQFQRYFSIAYPEQFKALFDGRTYTTKDMQRVEAEYFRELKKANNDNEKAFRQALRFLL